MPPSQTQSLLIGEPFPLSYVISALQNQRQRTAPCFQDTLIIVCEIFFAALGRIRRQFCEGFRFRRTQVFLFETFDLSLFHVMHVSNLRSQSFVKCMKASAVPHWMVPFHWNRCHFDRGAHREQKI